MEIIFDSVVGIYRIIILLLSIILTVIFGAAVVSALNYVLQSVYVPCPDSISFLVMFVTPVATLYGITIEKYFWKRLNTFNVLIFAVSFLCGILLTFIPIDVIIPGAQGFSCPSSGIISSLLVHIFGTGIIASLFAFAGLDFGVALKEVSKKIWVTAHKKKSAVRRITKRKKR